MNIQKILVIGGTGMLGFPVVKQLIADGYDTSILTRNSAAAKAKFGKSYHYVEGDVRLPVALEEAFDKHSFDGIHINLASMNYDELRKIEVEGTNNVMEIAKSREIQKITIISGVGVHQRNAWSRIIREKVKIDEAVKNSGIPYTIFHCTHFMESIRQYERNGKITVIGKQPQKWSWTAAEDYAKMVSKAFSTEDSNSKVISVLGPQQFTMKEVFSRYIDEVDPSLKFAELPVGMMKFLGTVTFNKTFKYVGDLMDYFDKTAEVPEEGTLLDILGTPSTTFDEWLTIQKESIVSV